MISKNLMILQVDLSKGKIVKEQLDMGLAGKFLGGRGINSKILYDEVGANVDPLGPENVLIFGTGPLTGTLAPSSGRLVVTAKSPLTGTHGDSNAGGHWAPELKFAGYDHVIFHGRADKPVYLWIDDDRVEIRDAKDVWGKDTWETERVLREELGDDTIQVASIGPAGENLVRFACIICNLTRAAGRCGMGAVMGSKRLKAIAVRGTKGIEVADWKAFIEIIDEAVKSIKTHTAYKFLSTMGTTALLSMMNELGRLPTRNFQVGMFEGADNIRGELYVKKYAVKSKACFGCPLHCSHYYVVGEGPYKGMYGEGPEYEALNNFGPRVGNDNLSVILKANTLINQLGLDATSTGAVISFAMECYQRGIIGEEDTDRLRLEWGDCEVILSLIERITYRKGFGNILAEGVMRASERIGKESAKYAIHTKGLEFTSIDLRGSKDYGLAYAVSTRGADHLRVMSPLDVFSDTRWHAGITLGIPLAKREEVNLNTLQTLFERELNRPVAIEKALDLYSPEAKGIWVNWFENYTTIIDTLGICKFPLQYLYFGVKPRHVVRIFNAVTGSNLNFGEMLRIGERVLNVERSFNVRIGMTRKHDTLPDRMLKEPMPNGPAKGQIVELDQMLDDYYKARGWDVKTGIPTREKLEELGLEDIATELKTQKGKNFGE